jgi:hypothetical protein
MTNTKKRISALQKANPNLSSVIGYFGLFRPIPTYSGQLRPPSLPPQLEPQPTARATGASGLLTFFPETFNLEPETYLPVQPGQG